MSKKTGQSELIDFLVEATKTVLSPLSILRLSRDFKAGSGASETVMCLEQRIFKIRSNIHHLQQVDLDTKVKMLFALSAPVNADHVEELRKFATVEIDEKKRITFYQSNDGSLQLKGDHSQSTKGKAVNAGSEHCYRKIIADFFDGIDCDGDNASQYKKEMVDVIKFVTARCENFVSPINIRQLMKDFQCHSGTSTSLNTLVSKIFAYRREIQNIDKTGLVPKVKQLFGLSASLNHDCLKDLRKEALVEVDEKNRITHYIANDGSFDLKGDHSVSKKMKAGHDVSDHCHRKIIVDFFNGIDCSGDNSNLYKKEMVPLIKFVTARCEKTVSPLNIRQLMKDFRNHSGTSTPLTTLEGKIYAYRREIRNIDKMDVVSKVKQLFGLSASLNPDYLEELREDALIEVDEKNRITQYKANDGSLELRGSHTRSTEHCYRKLIKFVTKKCENIESPLSIRQLIEEFKNHSGTSRASITLRKRINVYRQEIQLIDELNHSSKVKQLFGLSAPLSAECLKELRRAAQVEVDNRNRITEYKSNDGKLHLQRKRRSIVKAQVQRALKKLKSNKGSCSDEKDNESTDDESSDESDEDSEDEEESDEDTDEETDRESCEESDSEISSTLRDDPESHMESGNPVNNSFDIDYDPPMQNQEESMEEEIDEDKENESDVGDSSEEESTVKTRYGRLSRRRHLDSDFSYISRNSPSTSAASLVNTRGSKLPRSAKKKKRVESRGRAPTPLESISSALDTYSSRTFRKSTRNQAPPDERDSLDQPMENQDIPRDDQELFDYNGPMIQEMEPDDNNRIFIDPEDPPEDCNNPSDGAQEEAPMEEVKPPTEAEEAQNTVEKEVKPENQESGTSQELNGNDFVPLSSHIRLLEALQTIMITRNVPDLQEHQTRIGRTIEKFKEKGIEEEKITINEIRTSLMNTLLIVNKGARKEVIKGEETTSLKEFLIAFYGFVVHLNLKSLDNFSNRLKAMMEELTEEDKKFPIKNVSISLLSILVVVAP